MREGSIIVVTLIVFLYFVISTSNFLSGSSIKSLLPYFAPYAIMAAGQVFVMVLGEIDLSIGAVYLFVPFIWNSAHNAGIPLFPALVIAIIAAAAVGAINGFFTAYVGIASFVVTLGMQLFLAGLTLVISHSTQITTPGTTTAGGMDTLAKIFGGNTYSELIWAVVIVIILQVVLSRARWGTYTVAVGGNKFSAAEAGVNTRWVTMRNFILCASFAGLTGILEAVRTLSANPDPTSASNIMFLAIAAVIIGGTLMTGGEGTVVGALIGALFLGILTEGLNLKGISDNYLDLYLGLAVIVAMVINVYVRRVRRGSGLGS